MKVYRICHALCIKCEKFIVKSFLSRRIFLGVILDLDKYIFPGRGGGCVILESSCFQVSIVFRQGGNSLHF